jgi:hypothetical protein
VPPQENLEIASPFLSRNETVRAFGALLAIGILHDEETYTLGTPKSLWRAPEEASGVDLRVIAGR